MRERLRAWLRRWLGVQAMEDRGHPIDVVNKVAELDARCRALEYRLSKLPDDVPALEALWRERIDRIVSGKLGELAGEFARVEALERELRDELCLRRDDDDE